MNISDVRLTLYALLSSVETDLRSLLRSQILSRVHDLSFVKDVDRREKIAERYVRDHPDLDPDADISGAVEYFDFADTFEVLMQGTHGVAS